MERLSLCFVFMFMFVITTMIIGGEGQNQRQSWAKKILQGNDVVTTMQFYLHDTLSGTNPSAIKVVEPAKPNKYKTEFGVIMMADDPLTILPDPKSQEIGRARGLYGSAGQKDLGLIMAMSYSFNDGDFNGSTFNIMSINPALNPDRELAIVGGTGLFRMARGYAMAHTISLDDETGDAIVGYNVTIITKKAIF